MALSASAPRQAAGEVAAERVAVVAAEQQIAGRHLGLHVGRRLLAGGAGDPRLRDAVDVAEVHATGRPPARRQPLGVAMPELGQGVIGERATHAHGDLVQPRGAARVHREHEVHRRRVGAAELPVLGGAVTHVAEPHVAADGAWPAAARTAGPSLNAGGKALSTAGSTPSACSPSQVMPMFRQLAGR